MKRKILSAMFIAITTFSYAETVVTITVENPGEQGFNRVIEEHFDNSFDGTMDYHDLSCKDPGFTPCEWIIEPPSINGTSVTTIQYEVFRQVALGTLSGSTTIGGIAVSWNGSDSKHFKITLTYDE